jgi:hypothetical protein
VTLHGAVRTIVQRFGLSHWLRSHLLRVTDAIAEAAKTGKVVSVPI